MQKTKFQNLFNRFSKEILGNNKRKSVENKKKLKRKVLLNLIRKNADFDKNR